ncbi:MAG: hypothetical protein L3J59_15025 [Methylococcaceae bacterium]|nr:hypothetical protein [Methylococcaceae bacterium]
MFIKKSTVISISTLTFTLISNQVLAAEDTDSTSFLSIGHLILILLIALTVIFRKKIFAETAIDSQEEKNQELTEQKEPASATKTTPNPKKSPTPVKKTTKPKATASTKQEKAKGSASNNDLSDDGQCQGSTAKGARCKRTTTLEKISITIDDKTYQLTACSQHKNDKFKPYPGLIK